MTASASATMPREFEMKVTYKLPEGVKSFRYEPNTHFVELEDKKGNTSHLPAHGIMHHHCSDCRGEWWTKTNMSGFCPMCGSRKVTKKWGKLQVAFLPEKETDFLPPEQVGTGDLQLENVSEKDED